MIAKVTMDKNTIEILSFFADFQADILTDDNLCLGQSIFQSTKIYVVTPENMLK